MRYILVLPQWRVDRQPDFGGPAGQVALAQAAERAGFHAVTCSDHAVVPPDWAGRGGHHDLEPITTLAFLAAATTRLRLLTHVLVLPYRHPAHTAKALATLDVLSGGRVLAGVGAGYLDAEFRALGVPFADRNRCTDEALALLRELWTEPTVALGGAAVALLPRPVQQPHPPIWVGGNSTRAQDRAVRFGAAWMPFFTSPALAPSVRTAPLGDLADLADRIRVLRERAERAGRIEPVEVIGPAALVCAGGPRPDQELWPTLASADRVHDHVGRLRELGVGTTSVRFSGRTVEEQLGQLAWFADRVIGDEGQDPP